MQTAEVPVARLRRPARRRDRRLPRGTRPRSTGTARRPGCCTSRSSPHAPGRPVGDRWAGSQLRAEDHLDRSQAAA
jgi:hypothetical protein